MKKTGTVTLLGAGCGRGLMTVAGMEILRQADVVVYDDLIDTELLYEAKPDCQLIYVGKRFAKHSEKQEKIQNIIIEQAKNGKCVVRLKGGDSFVFGRGGEEMEALKEAGIPAQVIPGICSGIAVPEHVGIPVTHRGVAQTMTFITGHVASENHIDYDVLAKLDGTLVFFMGLHHAAEIAEKLMAGGKNPATPAAILSDGYGPHETKVTGTLDQLGDLAKTAKTPALILVGEVAGLDYSSTIHRPLENVSVTVTGTRYFTNKLGRLLEEKGAFVVKKPSMEVVPVEEHFPKSYEAYGWVAFTSANGVRGFFDHLKQEGTDLRSIMHLKFACIGSGSASMLKSYGFTADYVPADYTAEELGKGLGKILAPAGKTLERTVGISAEEAASISAEEAADKRVEGRDCERKLLILRAENGSKLLNVELDKAGIIYDDCKIYQTKALRLQMESQREMNTDYLVFGSANGARIHLQRLLNKEAEAGQKVAEAGQKDSQVSQISWQSGLVKSLKGTTIVCIGEATAGALAEFGITSENTKIIFPGSHTVDAIVEAVEEAFLISLPKFLGK